MPTKQPPDANARQIRLTMTALLMSLFVAMVSNLVVLTAMPSISAELQATQADYTWIITASMLTLAVSMPVWGRVADRFDKKRLIQLCVGGYVACSILASIAQVPWVIILARVGIGIGAAGIIILIQTISAAIMSARQQAQWLGYRAAVLSVATMGAPSLGGFITEHFGWRACFLVGVPLALISITMLQTSLHLPEARRQKLPVDWHGALALACGMGALMQWVTYFGPRWGYFHAEGAAILVLGLGCIAYALLYRRDAVPSILAIDLLRYPAVGLCTIASAGAGIGMFCSTVFLAPYLQIGRGLPPSISGLMALPEAAAGLLAAVITGKVISRHGHYKPTLVAGAIILTIGFVLLATLGPLTPYWVIAAYIALTGAGLGVIGETLALVVQNSVARSEIGGAIALVSFSRMVGGIGGVSLLGAVLAANVASRLAGTSAQGFANKALPALSRIAEAERSSIGIAYAHGVAHVYLFVVPVTLIVLLAILLLPVQALSDEHPSC